MRVNVRLGLVRGVLYWIRPNVLLGLLLAAGAVCAAVGGSITSLVFLGLWIQSCGGRGKGPAVEPSAESQADEAELLHGHHADLASDVDSEALEGEKLAQAGDGPLPGNAMYSAHGRDPLMGSCICL